MDETKLNAFLLKQLNNALALLAQYQLIGSTHVLYPKSVVDGVTQTLNNVGNTLSQSAQSNVDGVNVPKVAKPAPVIKPKEVKTEIVSNGK